MNEYTHACIKCSTKYKDSDPDPYYCASCIERNKILAQEIDAGIASRPRKNTKSDLQAFEELAKTRGIRGLVNAKDLF